MTRLIITNGDSAAGNLAASDYAAGARILAWQDALHWGEIPDRADWDAVSDIRANAMARMVPDRQPAKVRQDFRRRDETLRGHAAFERIELWFEHDLYDQLQLVQVLHLLHGLGRVTGVTLVQADDHLGRHGPETIARFADRSVPVTGLTLTEATLAWDAITAPTPAPVYDMVRHESCFLPYLCAALQRFLEDLPGPDGLARSERQILEAVRDGEGAPLKRLFGPCQAREDAAFEGDLGFLLWVHALALGPEPLLSGLADPMLPGEDGEAYTRVFDSVLTLTPAGRAVLAGRADHVALNGIDRWWAGTHLRPGAVWRWNDGALAAPG